MSRKRMRYGVASIGRLLTIIGLFCKRVLQKRRYSAKETCSFEEPTNRSHPICLCFACALGRIHTFIGLFFKIRVRWALLCEKETYKGVYSTACALGSFV